MVLQALCRSQWSSASFYVEEQFSFAVGEMKFPTGAMSLRERLDLALCVVEDKRDAYQHLLYRLAIILYWATSECPKLCLETKYKPTHVADELSVLSLGH